MKIRLEQYSILQKAHIYEIYLLINSTLVFSKEIYNTCTFCSSNLPLNGTGGGRQYGNESASVYGDFFSPEYAYILENANTLEAQFKKQPAHLERLYGMFNFYSTSFL